MVLALHMISVGLTMVAIGVAFAIEQPADVAINEMIVRPTVQVL
jgi:NADP-dependent 3-hydroxy acid dehydrogenase YdfG